KVPPVPRMLGSASWADWEVRGLVSSSPDVQRSSERPAGNPLEASGMAPTVPAQAGESSAIVSKAHVGVALSAYARAFVGSIREPLEEILAHFVLSVFAFAGIAALELILRIFGFAERLFFGIPVETWFFYLEVFALLLILSAGVYKTVKRIL